MTENPRSRNKLSPGRTLSTPLVRFEHLDHVARIILTRPNAGNAINAALIADLSAAWMPCGHSNRDRSSSLPRARIFPWVAMSSICLPQAATSPPNSTVAHGFHAAQPRLIGIGVPIVAAARGNVIGGGFGLALSSDYLLCSETARFSTGYSRLGLSADAGVSEF